MRKQDWSLVLFTMLSQLSVGLVLCLTALTYISGDAVAFFEVGLNPKNPVLLSFTLVAFATMISFLHLGKPVNAPKALNNLLGSWLSREILALGLYSAGLLMVLALGFGQIGFENIKYLLPLNTVLGLILLWMMIRIYTVPTIPSWNSWYTSVSFMSTAVCLGLVAILSLHHIGFVGIADPHFVKLVRMLAMVLLIEVVLGYLNQLRLLKMNTGIEKLAFDRGLFYKVFLLRMTLLIIALAVLVTIIYIPEIYSATGVYPWGFLLATVVFVQEIMGRFLFYSSYFRTGV